MINDEILNSISELTVDKEVFLVGGYLRNYFLENKTSYDRDIVTTSCAIDLAKDIASKLDATFIELDSENEIYRVVLKDKINYFDISKALENDILKDAKRRDFTINSIFYDLNKKEFFDPLDGISDIKKKIIRTIDLKNMTDDPLRLLRMYRFKALVGFEIDSELKNFAISNFDLIKKTAPERINQEILHIFEGKYLVETLLDMFEDKTLEKVFPFVSSIKRIPSNSHHHLDLIHHSIETVKNIKSDKPLLKLSAFYHDIGKPITWTIEPKGRHRFIGHDIKGGEIVKDELKKLKFSKKQIEYISDMVKYHIYPASLINSSDTKKAYAKFFRKLGNNVEDIIELSRADRLSAQGPAVTKEMLDKALNHLDNLLNYYFEIKDMVVAPKPLLNGNEIMEILNIKPSSALGKIIESLIEAQLAKTVLTKEGAKTFIKNLKF